MTKQIDNIKNKTEGLEEYISKLQSDFEALKKARSDCRTLHDGKVAVLEKEVGDIENSLGVLNGEIKNIVQLRNKINSLVWKIITAIAILIATIMVEKHFRKDPVDEKLKVIENAIKQMNETTETYRALSNANRATDNATRDSNRAIDKADKISEEQNK